MVIKPLQMNRLKNQINIKIKPPLNAVGQLTGYNKPQFNSKIFQIPVNLIDGAFEMEDPCPQKRLFLKLSVGSQNYFGSVRHLTLPNLSNLRDLGGYQSNYGIVKWGYLYRSDALSDLNPWETQFLKTLQINTVIDLRSAPEIRRNPDVSVGEENHEEIDPKAFIAAQASKIPNPKNYDERRVRELENISQSPGGEEKLIQMQNQMIIQMHDMVASKSSQEAYGRFLQMIVAASGPVLFHCQGGKDRTGWGTALLLGLLGVDRDVIMRDYLLTKKYNQHRNAKRLATYKKYTNNELVLKYLCSLQLANSSYLNSALDTLINISGSFEKYAEDKLNFTNSDLKNLRKKYLI